MRLGRWRRDPRLKEGALSVGYLGLIVVTALILTDRTWLPAVRHEGLIAGIAAAVGSLLGGPESAYLAIGGCWVGAMIVWALDTYKQRLVIAPLTLTVVLLYGAGIGLDTVFREMTLNGGIWFLVFTAVTVESCGIRLIRSNRGRVGTAPYEFRRGATLILVIVGMAVALGLLDAWQRGLQPEELVAGTGLVFGVWKLTRYDDEIRIVQLGPAGAGKTTMVGGLLSAARGAKTNDAKLEEIETRLENGELPNERTRQDEFRLLEFSYLSSDRLFKKKTTVTSVEHSGELLVGDDDSVSDKIEARRRRSVPWSGAPLHVRLYRWVRDVTGIPDGDDVWEQAMEDGSRLYDDQTERLAALVEGADVVLLTVPLEDFLGPIIDPDHDRTPPDYVHPYIVERPARDEYRIGVPDDIEPEAEADAVKPGSEITVVETADGLQYVSDGSAVDGLGFDLIEDPRPMGGDGGYALQGRNRCHPDEYGEEYKTLIDRLQGHGDKSFVWVATMADLVYDDFADSYWGVSHALGGNGDFDPGDTRHIRQTEGTPLFESSNAATDLLTEPGKKLFSRWIQKEYIEAVWTDFDETLADTSEEFIHPVWFEVRDRTPDGYLAIDSDQTPILRGGDRLLDRLEGWKLVAEEPLFDETDIYRLGTRAMREYRTEYGGTETGDEDGTEP